MEGKVEITTARAGELVDALRDEINVEELYDVIYNHFFSFTAPHDTLSKEEFLSIALDMVNY